jgi:hypothetical protein
MFALTLVLNARPITVGSSSTWHRFAGMMARPAAISLRTFSTSTPSRSATNCISSVTTPARAQVSWVSPALRRATQAERRSGSPPPGRTGGPDVS